MNDTLTNESPCVIKLIKDVKSVYESMDDGGNNAGDVEIRFSSANQKFYISQDISFQMPTCDGGIYWEHETAWSVEYTWNEMSNWFFQNRPFTYDEFMIYNKDKLGEIYVNLEPEELESTTIEQMSKFYFHNRTFGYQEDLAYCHNDIGSSLLEP